jgi:hypothetical protein
MYINAVCQLQFQMYSSNCRILIINRPKSKYILHVATMLSYNLQITYFNKNVLLFGGLLPHVLEPILSVASVVIASQFREFVVFVLLTVGNFMYVVGVASSGITFILNFVKIGLGFKS